MTRVTLAPWLLVALLALDACADHDVPNNQQRPESLDDGYSCVVPVGWSQRRDNGAVIFTSTKNPKQTIAIRSLALSGSRTIPDALAQTEAVLRGLPGVEVSSSREIGGPLAAREYRLSFAPPNATGRYARRHIVLRGQHHLFHVIETSPVTVPTDDAILTIAASMREES